MTTNMSPLKWQDGSPVPYMNFQFNGKMGCFTLKKGQKRWDIINCSQKLNFICQKPTPKILMHCLPPVYLIVEERREKGLAQSESVRSMKFIFGDHYMLYGYGAIGLVFILLLCMCYCFFTDSAPVKPIKENPYEVVMTE